MQIMGQYTDVAYDLDFSQYIAPNFKRKKVIRGYSCGEYVLHQLTDKTFTQQEDKLYGIPKILPMDAMVSILKKRKYTVVPLTVCGVTNSHYIRNAVEHLHVVVNCQLYARNEASWSICWNNMYFHGGWENAPPMLEFINRPILASWIVWHKSWGYGF